MSKKILIVVSFVLFTYSLLSCVRGAGEMINLWNFTENMSALSDKPEAVAVDSQRNIIVAGWSQLSDRQWEIRKFDEDKNLLLNISIDVETGREQSYGVAVDSNDNIIVVGYDSNSSIPNDYQWRVMKFTPDGVSLKNYTINFSSSYDQAKDVAIDSEDNIIVVGYDRNKSNINEPSNYQWRIMKLNTTLDHQWNYSANFSDGTDFAWAVAVNKSNFIVVVGYDYNTTYPGSLTVYPDKLGGYEWRIMKFTPDGISLKNYTIDFSTGADYAWDVAIDSQDNIIVVGEDNNKTNPQWRIMKLNTTLDHQWNYSANPSISLDKSYGVAIDSEDNIIVVGYDSNTTYPDKLGGYEWRIMKFTPDGISLKNHTIDPSIRTDILTAVTIDSYNNIISVGYDYNETSGSSDYQWRIMKSTFCGNEVIEDIEDCDYKNMHPDSPCETYQYCNEICRCQDLFNVWVEPNEMLFTVSQKTPVNLYIRNTGNDTDSYSVEAINPNPAVVEVDVSGSSPTKTVDFMSTELLRPWITVLATTTSEIITFKVTSLTNPVKYRTVTLTVLQGLPISLPEFNILSLISLMILVGIVYFLVKPK